MKKKIINDSITINAKCGLTIDELIEKYNNIVLDLFNKYDNVHDIKIEPESREDYDNYYRNFVINFKRLETSEEFEERKNWTECHDQEIKEWGNNKIKGIY